MEAIDPSRLPCVSSAATRASSAQGDPQPAAAHRQPLNKDMERLPLSNNGQKKPESQDRDAAIKHRRELDPRNVILNELNRIKAQREASFDRERLAIGIANASARNATNTIAYGVQSALDAARRDIRAAKERREQEVEQLDVQEGAALNRLDLLHEDAEYIRMGYDMYDM